MASVIKTVSFDAADALALATMQDPEGNEFCVERGPAALPCG
jgi:hypothetical protein